MPIKVRLSDSPSVARERREVVSNDVHVPCMQVGDTLPSVEVHEGTPGEKVNVKDLFAGKKGILIGVPGAFTPTCHKVRGRLRVCYVDITQ